MKLELFNKNFQTCEKVYGSREYHAAICTRYGRKLLVGPIQEDAKTLVGKFFRSRKNRLELLDMQVTETYIYLAFRCWGKLPATQVLRDIRREVGPILRRRFPELKTKVPSLWSPDVYVSSAGQPTLEDFLVYAASQKGV